MREQSFAPSLLVDGAFEQAKPVLDLLPIGVVACDGAGEIRCYNEHAVRLWGRRPAPGERFTGAMKLLRRDGEPLGGDAPLARALRSGRAVEPVRILIERPDGTVLAVETFASPLRDAVGACVGAIEMLREQVSVAIEDVAPLDASALQVATSSPPAIDALERLDLTRVVIDVTERFTVRAREVASPIVLEATPVAVRADRARLDHVVAQLVDNALKFGPGQPIEVAIARVGARALIAVRDHGAGIPPEQHAGLFERREGVGLWMARRLIEAMDGTIDVASEPGFGATFTVELPAA